MSLDNDAKSLSNLSDLNSELFIDGIELTEAKGDALDWFTPTTSSDTLFFRLRI